MEPDGKGRKKIRKVKLDESSILFLLFCGGAVCGLLLPKWIHLNVSEGYCLIDLNTLKKFSQWKIGWGVMLWKTIKKRMALLLLLYFSSYTAAGYGILAAAGIIFGITLGFLLSFSVIWLSWWGLAFLLCALFPQWVFYAAAGSRIVRFMQSRRMQCLMCSGPVLPTPNRKILHMFFEIAILTGCGIVAEVYVNPLLIRLFLITYPG